MHTRQELLQAAWDASAWQFPDGYTLDDFSRDASQCDFWPIVVGGKLVGAVMVNGCEIHVCVKPEWFRRWATPGLYRRVENLRRMHGRLVTRVHHDHEDGIRFCRRFGFKMIGNIGPVLIFEKR